ncbi:MAG: cysteine peptidase family C39 domain-containing protein, partial [bacterium]
LEITKDEEFPTSTGNKSTFRWRWRLWVDPNSDWCILRRVDYAPDGRIVYTLELSEYRKYDSDISLPTRVISTLYVYDVDTKKNIAVSCKSFAVKNCKVNGEIPDHIFSPQIPNGVLVWDTISDETYIVGEKKPIDEDILQVAGVARQLLEGTISVREIERDFGPQKGKRSEKFCGPNALLAVCGILGIKTSSKEIAQLAGTDEKGFTSLAGLKRAAEALGLKAEGVDITLDELRKSKKLAIAFIPPDHFIVVVGFSADKVVIIDPPTMLGAVPLYALDEVWDGRALLLSKPE